MATIAPDDEEPTPTPVERVARAVAAPFTDRTPRIVALLAAGAGLSALAPAPMNVAAVAALTAVAWELGRKR